MYQQAIGLHLLLNASCAKHYHQDRFRILARGRSSFHLSVWNPFLLKHQIPTFAGKKNLFTVLRSIAD